MHDFNMRRRGEIAYEKAIELLRMLRERFPETPYTIEILHWDDETFCVRCKYCDDELILHMYEYLSAKNETRYSEIEMKDAIETFKKGKEVLIDEVVE